MPTNADRRLLGQIQDSLVHKADGSIVLVVDRCHFQILWCMHVVLTFLDWCECFIVFYPFPYHNLLEIVLLVSTQT